VAAAVEMPAERLLSRTSVKSIGYKKFLQAATHSTALIGVKWNIV
jgi:hypothetical protein